MDGVLVLDKPRGMTSHAAVVATRRILGESRIGHLGTLDLFSTGVLVLLVGQVTRLAQFYREREKVYEGTIRFGFSTDTFDCTGTPTSVEQVPRLDETNLRKLLREVVGAHLYQLRRVAVGEFHQNQALSLEQLEEKVRHQENALIPTEELLPEFPAVVLTDKASRT